MKKLFTTVGFLICGFWHSTMAVYIVFFDIATRRVISAEREIHSVSSAGNFRNFWFGPIKETDKSLSKYSKKIENASFPAFEHAGKRF